MGYSIINLNGGYLGFINIDNVEILQKLNTKRSNYKKIDHPVDSRDPHRSSLLAQLNYLSTLSFEGIEDEKKDFNELIIKVNPNLLLERKILNG